ncbi:hypothetical protein [Halopiger xanaduensis]|uniref:Uncharacterized protein n=1 Tax=Halopiger xanaduensis (strain DSM 18323 / JCM 14033 / SH-6) TaxID=797210 RepID=F8DCA5_HALXS|nr:hypothetical protein [Halopiger xanaduensis]AEH38362.1 hypothetical protein Halxa_3756 [Halopiger xanaduensis SH-6]
MSDERSPDDNNHDRDDRAAGSPGPPDSDTDTDSSSSAPTDDGRVDESTADDAPGAADSGEPSETRRSTSDPRSEGGSPSDSHEGRHEQADGGYSEERTPPEQRDRESPPESGTEPGPEEPGEPAGQPSTGGLADRAAFWLSALFGLALAVGSVALVSGRAPFFEDVLRIRPSVEGGGVGADWVAGNTEPVLEAMITVVHFADVIMGIFILVMVFVHWAAFRRLGARMRPPSGTQRREAAAATDGGVSESGGDTDADGDGAGADDATTEDRAGDDGPGGDRP